MSLENLKSVFSPTGDTTFQPPGPSANPNVNINTFQPPGPSANTNVNINPFQPDILGAGDLSGASQTQGIKDTRISFGVGTPFPISDLRFKVGLAKLGNRASIYYLGSGKENYKNWGGYTKAGDTLAVTGELSNFGPIENFLNNSLGITVPDIPLLFDINKDPDLNSLTFHPPINYTDTVFELRGTSATGTYEDSMGGLRGVAMQVMKGNKLGEMNTNPFNDQLSPQTTLDGKSFVKFVNQQKGSAAQDVTDFVIDTASDIGSAVGSLAVDTGNAIKSSLADLFKPQPYGQDFDLKISKPPKFNFDKYGPKIPKFSGSPISLDIKLPKLKAPTVDLPSLSFLSDLIPDMPEGANRFQLGEGGQRIANFFGSVGGAIGKVSNFIVIKPSRGVLDFLDDIQNDVSKGALRFRNDTIEYLQKEKQQLANQIAKPIKNRLKEFGEEVSNAVTTNYKNLEKDLKEGLKPRIPGAGEGGGVGLNEGVNPRAIPDVSRGAPTPKRTNTYSELGANIKSGRNGVGQAGSYESDVKNEKALGDPAEGQSVSNPNLLSNKHVNGNQGNIFSSEAGLSGIGQLETPFQAVPPESKYERTETAKEQIRNEDGEIEYDGSTKFHEERNDLIDGFIEKPYNGLDKSNDKYSNNVGSKQIDIEYGDDRRVAGSFYPANVNGGMSDLHTVLPALNGDTLEGASKGWPNFQDVVESEQYGMPFYFKDLRDNKYVVFRAYLTSITEDLSPSWDSTNYIGRSEPVYNYSSTDRVINFTFKTAAHSQNELHMIYEKINMLTSMVYPEYKKDFNLGGKLRMKPPLTRFRMGELFGNSKHEIAGFIKSLNYTWPENSPWEIANGKRVPKVCDVTVSYQVIHEAPPSYNTPAQHFHGYS